MSTHAPRFQVLCIFLYWHFVFGFRWFSKSLCILVPWTKVALGLIGLNIALCVCTSDNQFRNDDFTKYSKENCW